MALTVALVRHNIVGAAYESVVDITGDSSYATGGEALAAADLQTMMPKGGVLAATDADKIQLFQSEKDVSGRELALDRVNDKILFFAAGAEVANLTNLSAVTIRAVLRYGQVN